MKYLDSILNLINAGEENETLTWMHGKEHWTKIYHSGEISIDMDVPPIWDDPESDLVTLSAGDGRRRGVVLQMSFDGSVEEVADTEATIASGEELFEQSVDKEDIKDKVSKSDISVLNQILDGKVDSAIRNQPLGFVGLDGSGLIDPKFLGNALRFDERGKLQAIFFSGVPKLYSGKIDVKHFKGVATWSSYGTLDASRIANIVKLDSTGNIPGYHFKGVATLNDLDQIPADQLPKVATVNRNMLIPRDQLPNLPFLYAGAIPNRYLGEEVPILRVDGSIGRNNLKDVIYLNDEGKIPSKYFPEGFKVSVPHDYIDNPTVTDTNYTTEPMVFVSNSIPKTPFISMEGDPLNAPTKPTFYVTPFETADPDSNETMAQLYVALYLKGGKTPIEERYFKTTPENVTFTQPLNVGFEYLIVANYQDSSGDWASRPAKLAIATKQPREVFDVVETEAIDMDLVTDSTPPPLKLEIDLSGPAEGFYSDLLEFEIVGYDPDQDYVAEASIGTVAILENKLNLKLPRYSIANYVSVAVSVGDLKAERLIRMLNAYIQTPTIEQVGDPKERFTSLRPYITFSDPVVKPHYYDGVDEMEIKIFDLSNSDELPTYHDVVDYSKTWVVPPGCTSFGEDHYIQVRYVGKDSLISEWSERKRFIVEPFHILKGMEVGEILPDFSNVINLLTNEPVEYQETEVDLTQWGNKIVDVPNSPYVLFLGTTLCVYNVEDQSQTHYVIKDLVDNFSYLGESYLPMRFDPIDDLVVSEDGKCVAFSRTAGTYYHLEDSLTGKEAKNYLLGERPTIGGRVWVAEFRAGEISIVDKLSSPNACIGDRFGRSLSLNQDGTVIAVGTPHQPKTVKFKIGDSWDCGAVYVYRKDLESDNYNYVETIEESSGDVNDLFGFKVTLSPYGERLLVSAPTKSGGPYGRAGLITLYNNSVDRFVVRDQFYREELAALSGENVLTFSPDLTHIVYSTDTTVELINQTQDTHISIEGKAAYARYSVDSEHLVVGWATGEISVYKILPELNEVRRISGAINWTNFRTHGMQSDFEKHYVTMTVGAKQERVIKILE